MRITLLCTLLLAFVLAVPVGAEEDESPAARVFQGGWWAETAAGDLDRALTLYESVLGEEGPDSIKAHALLRIGLVQARTGKTEEAIRTFDRLAKAYPNEKAFLAQARERLEQWTAENLEDSFDEWYRRYQFSPAFQAKVVDLVLRLGTRNPKDGVADEEKELLTIGRAAIPALERHLDTSNETLRAWATSLLLQLGEMPPVEALLETQAWWGRSKAWVTLLTLDEKRAAAIREQAGKEGELGRVLGQVTRGPRAALELFSGQETATFRKKIGSSLMKALLERPGGKPSVEQLTRFVEQGTTHKTWWPVRVLEHLLERGEASDATLLRSLRDGNQGQRSVVMTRIMQGDWRHEEAWRALSEAALEDPTLLTKNSVFRDAFFKALGEAGEVDLEPAALAFAQAAAIDSDTFYIQPHGSYPVQGYWRGVERLVPAVLATSRDERAVSLALRAYSWALQAGEVDRDAGLDRLLAWAHDLPSPPARREAASGVGATVRDKQLDRVLAALPALDAETSDHFLRSLDSTMKRRSLALSDERLDAVIREHHRIREAGVRTYMAVLQTIAASEAGAVRVVERWLQAPEHMVWMSHPMSQYSKSPRFHELVRRGIEARWSSWSPEQRVAVVEGLRQLMGTLHEDAPFAAWIREQVRAPLPAEQADAARPARKALLGLLPQVAIEDLRPTFDLDDPAQALEAGSLHGLRQTPEAYATVRAAREHPDAKRRAEFWMRWTGRRPRGPQVAPATQRVVYRDMLRDPEAATRATATELLGKRRNMEDVFLLVVALEDESPRVRRRAAQALAQVYDRAAIQALVKRLDDPDPFVRELVMKTLETIKKAEEARDYWKDFAGDK